MQVDGARCQLYRQPAPEASLLTIQGAAVHGPQSCPELAGGCEAGGSRHAGTVQTVRLHLLPAGPRQDTAAPSQPGIDSAKVPDGKLLTCNCRKSRCLKLYCVCFAAGVQRPPWHCCWPVPSALPSTLLARLSVPQDGAGTRALFRSLSPLLLGSHPQSTTFLHNALLHLCMCGTDWEGSHTGLDLVRTILKLIFR